MTKVEAELTQRLAASSSMPRDKNGPTETPYGQDFLAVLSETRVKAVIDKLAPKLREADRLAEMLEPLITAFVILFDQSTAPVEVRDRLEKAAERMVFFGLRVHCLCYDCPSRFQHDEPTSLEKLYKEWSARLRLLSLLRDYDRANGGFPSEIFGLSYETYVEPIQKEIGLGWWRRKIKNERAFRSLFIAGLHLGMMYDMMSLKLGSAESAHASSSAKL